MKKNAVLASKQTIEPTVASARRQRKKKSKKPEKGSKHRERKGRKSCPGAENKDPSGHDYGEEEANVRALKKKHHRS